MLIIYYIQRTPNYELAYFKNIINTTSSSKCFCLKFFYNITVKLTGIIISLQNDYIVNALRKPIPSTHKFRN